MRKEIKKIIEEQLIENVKIEKVEDIQENINSGYYFQKKYKQFSNEDMSIIKSKVEEIVNNTVSPRDYSNKMKETYKIIQDEIRKTKVGNIVEETWQTDWFLENNIIDDAVQNSISNLIFEIEPDIYNLVSYADNILEVVDAAMISVKTN